MSTDENDLVEQRAQAAREKLEGLEDPASQKDFDTWLESEYPHLSLPEASLPGARAKDKVKAKPGDKVQELSPEERNRLLGLDAGDVSGQDLDRDELEVPPEVQDSLDQAQDWVKGTEELTQERIDRVKRLYEKNPDLARTYCETRYEETRAILHKAFANIVVLTEALGFLHADQDLNKAAVKPKAQTLIRDAGFLVALLGHVYDEAEADEEAP